MKANTGFNEPGCREALAGEYVLGTLTGAARRRFERLLQQSPDLQLYVVEWERTLAPLAEAVEPVRPPGRIWRSIRRRIGVPRNGWWGRLAFWRPFGLVAATLLVAVTLFVGLDSTDRVPGDYVFVVQGEAGQVQWVVIASLETRRMNIRPVEPPGVGPERLCRLWWNPERGPPRVLAVLPEGNESVQVRLPEGLGGQWQRGEMSVTIGPAEWTPTAPSGEEVFRGRWAPMT